MSTVDHTGQGVSGTVDSPFAVRIEIGAAGNLRLHPHEHILIDDGFMAAFHIVLRSLSIVDTALLVQNTDRVCLLQKGIACVLTAKNYVVICTERLVTLLSKIVNRLLLKNRV